MREITIRASRTAVTLIEVIFSIGVILIGLLGLMSILPLAGRRAQDSVSLSVGAEMGQAVIDELQTRKFYSSDRLIRIKPSTSAVVTSLLPPALNPARPFCIDPMFASQAVVPGSVSNNGYEVSLFPYYSENHDPLIDPSNDSSGGTSSTTWPSVQPRMLRVGITDEVHNASSPAVSRILVGAEEALALVENYDDLPVNRPKDRSLNANFSALKSDTDAAAIEYGKRVPTGEFSWIATVNPLPGNIYASVSVVVIRNRERTFEVSAATLPPETPRGNALSERLAYVSYASGFRGGSGGVVHLVSSGNTVSKVKSNDWLMLSRTNSAGVSVHRWYRVVSVGEEPEVFKPESNTVLVSLPTSIPLPDPGWSRTGNSVWRQKVVLDGADWFFGFSGSAGSGYATNTYATLVENVVSVTERVVLLSDL